MGRWKSLCTLFMLQEEQTKINSLITFSARTHRYLHGLKGCVYASGAELFGVCWFQFFLRRCNVNNTVALIWNRTTSRETKFLHKLQPINPRKNIYLLFFCVAVSNNPKGRSKTCVLYRRPAYLLSFIFFFYLNREYIREYTCLCHVNHGRHLWTKRNSISTR